MTNLERARKGERLKVEKTRDNVYIGVNGATWIFDEAYLENWINKQIDHAVTHAIDDTSDPVLWRDLGPDDIIQEGDRYYSNLLDEWVYVSLDGRVGTKVTNSIVQRPAKLETNS